MTTHHEMRIYAQSAIDKHKSDESNTALWTPAVLGDCILSLLNELGDGGQDPYRDAWRALREMDGTASWFNFGLRSAMQALEDDLDLNEPEIIGLARNPFEKGQPDASR